MALQGQTPASLSARAPAIKLDNRSSAELHAFERWASTPLLPALLGEGAGTAWSFVVTWLSQVVNRASHLSCLLQRCSERKRTAVQDLQRFVDQFQGMLQRFIDYFQGQTQANADRIGSV
jgi:hypothetical protein